MSGGDVMNGGDRRVELEQRADAVRSRLERRLDALDERRDRVLEFAKKATHPPVSIALLGTAAVLGAAVVAYQIHKRPKRGQRIGASLLGVPARKAEGFLMKAFKRGALAFVATLVQRVSTRGLDRLLPEAPPPARVPEVPRPRAY
jgi:hypothetical protein